MQLNVFVTVDEKAARTGPILFVPATPAPVLPQHPGSLEWSYFATVDEGDSLLGIDRYQALEGIRAEGFYIANRLV